MATPSAYCVAADLYENGLPRGALPNPGRLVADTVVATEIMSLDGHGFALDTQLLFRAEEGGALPTPLVADTVYFAKPVTDSTFQVAATAGGSAINLTTAGSRVVVTAPLPFAKAIEWASAIVDDFLPAHVVPMTPPYHVTVVTVTATLAAQKLLSFTGQAPGTLEDLITWAQRTLERWAKGVPLRGANVPSPANLAVSAVASARDPRGWAPDGGTLP